MLIDGNIGGAIDGTDGAEISGINDQVKRAERIGYDSVWSTEVSRDPFFPLLLAAEHSPTLHVGTSIAVAFARNPMSVATVANDLHSLSSGRFHLGLGSQIKPHIEKRFSMPWSAPADRMREFVSATRAIWDCWNNETDLDFEGRFYRHTLMTPMFRPTPNAWGTPPILIAAVGPHMTSVAAEVADGILLHGFTTPRYLSEVTMPAIEAALEKAGRDRADFTLSYPGLVVTGATEAEFDAAASAVRKQIAFYGSTPAYRGVLEQHGWGDLQTELHSLSRTGDWAAMADLIDDDILDACAVVGEPAAVAAEIDRRFGSTVDRFSLYTPYELSETAATTIVAEIRRIGSVADALEGDTPRDV